MKFTGKVLMLALLAAPLAAPYLAHAQLSIGGSPCRDGKPRSEGRTEDLGQKYNVRISYPIAIEDYQARYCVTEEKCIALGYCKANSPAEQAAAEKLHPEAVAERARLQREQQEQEAKAERERRAAEAERNRKAAEVAREIQRLGSHREAEARRLVEMREAAAKARGGTTATPTPKPETAGEPRKVCTSAPFKTTSFGFTDTEADARTASARDAANLCRQNTGNPAYTAGTVSCVREDISVSAHVPLAKRPANDPPRFKFKCTTPIVCAAPKETCKTEGTVRSSGQ